MTIILHMSKNDLSITILFFDIFQTFYVDNLFKNRTWSIDSMIQLSNY